MTAELPIPDYDQLPLGDLRHRIRSRLDELAKDAEPSGGDPRNAGAPRVSAQRSPNDNTPLRHGVHQQTPARGR